MSARIAIVCLAAFGMLIAGCGGGTSGGFISQTLPSPSPSMSATATPTTSASPTASARPTAPATATPGALGVSPSSMQFTATAQSAIATISEPGYSGTYTAVSSNKSIAIVSVSGSTVTVTAGSAGSATVTISDKYGQQTTISVGVTTTTGVVN